MMMTCWGDVNLFCCARDPLDGAHEDVRHDAHAQEAVEQREEVDGGTDLSRPRVLNTKNNNNLTWSML